VADELPGMYREFTPGFEIMAQIHMEQGNLSSAKTLLREAANTSQAGVKDKLILCALLAEITAKEAELDEAVDQLRKAQGILSNGEDWHGVEAKVPKYPNQKVER